MGTALEMEPAAKGSLNGTPITSAYKGLLQEPEPRLKATDVIRPAREHGRQRMVA